MSDFQAMFNCESLQKEYENYVDNTEKIKIFSEFLNSITVDKFEINNSIKHNSNHRKFSKTNKYNINSFLNKLSDNNIQTIKDKILSIINNNTNIYNNIIIDILNYCTLQYKYCYLYLDLLVRIFEPLNYNYNTVIEKYINNYIFPTFVVETTDNPIHENNESMYDNNKKLSNLLGYSALVACVEKNNILCCVNTIFNKLLLEYTTSNDNTIKYKYIQAIYIIMKELYENMLPDKYFTPLQDLLKTPNIDLKSKFKIMDIIDRK